MFVSVIDEDHSILKVKKNKPIFCRALTILSSSKETIHEKRN